MKVTRKLIVRAIAYCDNCNWTNSLDDTDYCMSVLRVSIKRHIKNTGHSVVLETGISTTYCKK